MFLRFLCSPASLPHMFSSTVGSLCETKPLGNAFRWNWLTGSVCWDVPLRRIVANRLPWCHVRNGGKRTTCAISTYIDPRMTLENARVLKGFFVMPFLRHSLQAWLTGKVRSVSWRKSWTLPTVLLLLWSGYTLRIFLCSRCNLTYFTMNELTSIDAEAGGCGTTSHLVSFFFPPFCWYSVYSW